MEKQKSYYEQFDSEQKGPIQVIKTGNLNISTGENTYKEQTMHHYVETMAIEFAEWLKHNEYYMRSNGRNEWFDLSQTDDKKLKVYTTKELFDKFLKETKNK